MEILELNMKHFGKFLEHKMKLFPGVNIIYGGNETGKSTIHAFIRAMFFGIEAGRGRKGEEYLLRQPWDNPAYFAGALRLDYKGKTFRIERNFNKNEKEVRLICENSGQELSAEQEELSALLAGMSEAAFVNTVFIPQAGSETDAGLAEELQKFMINFQETRDGDLDVRKALDRLKIRKKELENKRKQEQELLDEKISRKQMELDYVQQEMAKLSGEQRKSAEEQKELSGEQRELSGEQRELELWPGLGKEEEAEEDLDDGFYRRFLLLRNVLLLAGSILGLACGFVVQGTGGKLALFSIGGLLLILFGMAVRYTMLGRKEAEARGDSRNEGSGEGGSKKRDKSEGRSKNRGESEDGIRSKNRKYKKGRTWEDDFGADSNQEEEAGAETNKNSRERRLLERGKLLWKHEERQNQMQDRNVRIEILQKELEELFHQREQLYSYQRETEAVELAMLRIRELSERIYREAGSDFGDRASVILEELTEGRYTHIALDEKMQVKINTPTRLLELRQVSYGTMNQIYFALRMAAGEILTGGQPLPIILDEAFAMYDEERLEAALRWLDRSRRQVILFTCQKREKYILDKIRKGE